MTSSWIVLSHRHFHAIAEDSMLAALPADIRSGPRERLDIACQPVDDWQQADWPALQREQAAKAAELLRLRDTGKGVAYFGRTRLPLAMDLGYRLEKWTKTLTFVEHRGEVWAWPGRETDEVPIRPVIDDESLPRRQSFSNAPVIVRVSVANRIAPKDVHGVVPGSQADVEVHLGDRVGREALKTHEDLERTAEAFARALDAIRERLPHTEAIHVFAAVPAGLAFRMGTLINHAAYPRVQTYQFWPKATPSYQPALVLGEIMKPVTKMKIQFLAAQPEATVQIRTDIELRQIADSLRDGEHRDRFDIIKSEPAVRRKEIQRIIRRGEAHILHLSAHGLAGGYLVFHDAADRPEHVRPDHMKLLIDSWNEDDRIRCVVLNACHSHILAKTLTEAPAVVRAAIGTISDVKDKAAIEFAEEFYSALADGATLGQAFQAGYNGAHAISKSEADKYQIFYSDPAVAKQPLFAS